MILAALTFVVLLIITWRIIQASYNPLAHWLGAGSDNEESMHESQVQRLLDTAGRYYSEHNWLSAEKAYLRVLKMDHTNIYAFRRLAMVYTYLHNYEDAAESMELVIKRGGTAADYQNYSTILYHAGKKPQAIIAMELALEREPTLARSIALAKLYAASGDHEKQFRALHTALEGAPGDETLRGLMRDWQAQHGGVRPDKK